MMAHLPVLPILIPLLGGLLLLLPPFAGIERYVNRRIGVTLLMLLHIGATLLLMFQVSQQGPVMYAIGDWQAPFGIIMFADPLAVILVLLTGFLGLASTLYAFGGTDREGRYFHPLMQFQLMGITGAFLTHDLFNLFVFFEVLLIASYALLIHGGGKQKTLANVHYVILNLVGSSLFLFALGTLYGTTGTLNIADMSLKISSLTPGEQVIAEAGAMLLLVVFGLKAAMLPLHFWLPRTYAAASAPVAALFAIMTKVGVYGIFRVYTVVFGDQAGNLSDVIQPWIWPLSIATVFIGTVGALASPHLRGLAANLVIISVGTLLMAFAIRTPEASAAGFYYLIHSTLISAALFLIADMIGRQRGKAEDRFVIARKVEQPALLGLLFFVAAMAIAGLPPFSGFIGKLVILQSAATGSDKFWVWPVILVSSLLSIVALSRAGTTLFWRHAGERDKADESVVSYWQISGVLLLLLASPVIVVFGATVTDYTGQAAQQLHDLSTAVRVLQLPGAQP
ncbi:monovalent cation/H+ antiporter subunit D [Alteromonas halophila]|uniref:Monovalent cation/H+ antiporter subunit D n=1 Tax=Alteromonas halophila TaxID=516698 RepID=A0A918JIQ2_9ALTE|nr:monovalent cation/H+ antiporter subunit D [Alteromonas halophila]GGW83207.1 monovalent cation/H+ antiporter subunit D [Alteromonas halophila]